MDFQFKCPQCGQVIIGDDSFSGQVAPCPFCEKNIVIPKAKSLVTVSKPKPKQPIRWKRGQQTTSQGDTAGNPVELQSETITAQKAKTGFWRRLRACFTTKGRAQRKEFWIIEGVSLICSLLIGLFVIFVVSSKQATAASKSSLILVAVLGLAFWIASLCVWIRRLHDLNRSEWWLLSPIVGKIACKFLGFSLFSVLMDLACLAWFIVLGSINGTPGENDYGSDPKGRVGTGEQTNTSKIAIWILSAVSALVSVIAIAARNLIPETALQEEVGLRELRQSASDEKEEQSEEVNELGADTLRKGLSEAFQEQGSYLRVGNILEFSLVKVHSNAYSGLARVKIHTAKGTSASAVVRYSLDGTYDGSNLLLKWQAFPADVDKLDKLLKKADYE